MLRTRRRSERERSDPPRAPGDPATHRNVRSLVLERTDRGLFVELASPQVARKGWNAQLLEGCGCPNRMRDLDLGSCWHVEFSYCMSRMQMIDTYDSCTCINIGKATFLSNHIHTPKPKCSMYEHMALETTPMYSRQICHTWSVWEWVGSFIPAKSQSLSSFSSLSCSSGCCSTTFKLATYFWIASWLAHSGQTINCLNVYNIFTLGAQLGRQRGITKTFNYIFTVPSKRNGSQMVSITCWSGLNHLLRYGFDLECILRDLVPDLAGLHPLQVHMCGTNVGAGHIPGWAKMGTKHKITKHPEPHKIHQMAFSIF